MARARMSVLPPGGKGTTIWMALVGQFEGAWAKAVLASAHGGQGDQELTAVHQNSTFSPGLSWMTWGAQSPNASRNWGRVPRASGLVP